MNPLTRKYEDFVKMKKETTKVASEFSSYLCFSSDLLTFFENFPTNEPNNHNEHDSHNHHRSIMFD